MGAMKAKEATNRRDNKKKSLPADCKILRSREIKIVSWRSKSGTPAYRYAGRGGEERRVFNIYPFTDFFQLQAGEKESAGEERSGTISAASTNKI